MSIHIKNIEMGLLVDFSAFVSVLAPNHLEQIQRQAIPRYQGIMSQFFEEQSDEEFVAGMQKHVDEYVSTIESADSIVTVAKLLSSLVEECMPEEESYESFVFGGHIDDECGGEYNYNYWSELMLVQSIGGCVLPIEPLHVRVFRYHTFGDGPSDCSRDEFPFDVPLLEFRYSDCFETRTSDRGQALAETLSLGEISPRVWKRI